MDAPEENRLSDRILKAPYDGDCIACGKPYVWKDPVAYIGGRLCHYACREEEDETAVNPSLCPTCSADVTWVTDEKNRKLPIDKEPNLEGARYRKEKMDPSGTKWVYRVKDDELEANTKPLYTSHFDTCPGEEVEGERREDGSG